MAWKEVKVEEQRKRFIDELMLGKISVASACRKYDISRKTGYKWLERYQCEGLDGLIDRHRAPRVQASAISDDIIDLVIGVRAKYPYWGPKKVYAWLKDNKLLLEVPSPSTIGNIFDRYGLTVSRKLRRRVAANVPTIFTGDQPNDVWCFDFKGTVRTGNKKSYDPFTLTDNVSRYLIKNEILDKNRTSYVWAVLEAAFLEFGLPERVLSDNGPPFATAGAGRLSKVSINLIKAGVKPTWITPGKPQQNGRHERMHGTLERELESQNAYSKSELCRKLKEFQHYFNFERPHEALGQKTPGSIYVPSTRVWDGTLRSPEYTADYRVRKVQKCGTISLPGVKVFISETLHGEPVGCIEKNNGLNIYYGSILLGVVNNESSLEYPRVNNRRKALS